jgi:hypothetical protein
MTTTYRAAYEGKTYTRKTDRTYTHAVGCTLGAARGAREGEEGIVAWCGTAALAAKAAKKYAAAQWGFSKVQIVEVQQ